MPLVSDENIMDWLLPVRSRVDIRTCFTDAALQYALTKVYVFGLRYVHISKSYCNLLIFSYGIKAAYSETFASTYFQAAIEDMDH